MVGSGGKLVEDGAADVSNTYATSCSPFRPAAMYWISARHTPRCDRDARDSRNGEHRHCLRTAGRGRVRCLLQFAQLGVRHARAAQCHEVQTLQSPGLCVRISRQRPCNGGFACGR